MKLYGKNPVLERIKTNPKSIHKIFIQEGHEEAGYIQKKSRQFGIACIHVPRSKIQKLSQSLNTQGVVADVADFAYTPYDDLLTLAVGKKITLIFLDGVTDPQNFGAMIRSLACLGKFAVVLPTHDSVSITEAVLRVASGGDNHIFVARVGNLSQSIVEAKDAGFFIAGAFVDEGEDLYRVKFQFPLGFVVGSEQKGIREIIKKRLDQSIKIPMAQPRMSLNVAQATTIFAYEIIKQQKT